MDETDSSLRKIAKSTIILIIGIIISKLLGLVYRVLVARTGTEYYGLFSLGLAVLGISVTIASLGLNVGIVRYVSYYKGKQEFGNIKEIILFAIKTVFFWSIILSLIIFIFSDKIAINVFHDIRLSLVLKVISFIIPIASLREIFLSLIRAFQKTQYEIYSKNIFENIIKIILTATFIFLGFKLFGIVMAYSIALFLTFILTCYFIEKKVFSVFKTKSAFTPIKKELIFYSLPLLFSSLIFSIIIWTDTSMLGFFKDASQVGIYNAAIPIASMLFIFPYALMYLFIPVLTELYSQNKKESFASIHKTVTKWILLANLILLSIFIIIPKQIILLLFGQEYLSGSSALQILTIGNFLLYLFISSNEILTILKKTKLIFFNIFIGFILNIILNYFLIPKYGINGAALATSISLFLIALLFTSESYLITKVNPVKIRYFIKIISSFILSFLLTNYILKYFITLSNPLIIIFTSMVFCLIYILLLIITRSFDNEDKMVLKAIKQKIVSLNFFGNKS